MIGRDVRPSWMLAVGMPLKIRSMGTGSSERLSGNNLLVIEESREGQTGLRLRMMIT